jgi:uncharacterized coiled-coil DUF342 family protein
MAKKPKAPAESAPAVDPQQQYLMDQFGGLMDQVGDGFGGPLQEELIRRLEQTIADFHEEVNEMLSNLKDNSEKRHERLKEIWNNPDAAVDDVPDEADDGPGDENEMSDYEKRIEGLEGDNKDDEPQEKDEKPKKKKGFFGRKKK